MPALMPAFGRFAARDAAILGATALGWLAFGPLSAGSGLLADIAGAGLGVAAGACAWLAHEWGHLLAGRAAGATFRAPARLANVYLFGFDKTQNSQGQFVAMALGGFAATGIAIAIVFLALPDGWMATRVVRGLVLIEAGVTLVLEVPGLLLGLVAYDRLPSVDVLKE